MQEVSFQDEPVESEEERRRRRKEQKKAKKEKRAKEEKKKEEEEAATGGNIGYFVMRTPSVLDNSKQDEDEYLTTHHVVQKPLKSGNSQFSQNIQSRSPTQPTPSGRNSEVKSEEGGEVDRWREIEEVKDGYSSEEEGAQFFDSVSTPSASSQHQRDKSMGVSYFDLFSSLD